ncbi:MAG: tetratricopeptide repeat protein [Anaerolineae bacterium]|nr:tetratricopeptide repeat protein [Anaerolineae bacterium]
MSRARLIEQLNAGRDRKLTLVSAPAGYGKTTLVNAWLRSTARPFAWLALDEGDNDLARFLSYLVAAFQRIDSSIGQIAQNLLEAPHLPPVETLLTALINDAAARASPFLLVLDDYHTISERTVHEAVGFLLERQPPHMHLVIASRQDPPLPLSRLRGRGQIAEIRQSDLRFTREETTAFLNQSMGLHLEPSDVAALDVHTEGWIVGLQMAAVALQTRMAQEGTAGVPRFIDSFSGRHHFILDYLTDEVLERQPESITRFLLQTCILERMCGPLCDAVTNPAGTEESGLSAGQQVLEHLQQANLFVVPLDDERQWYRYHRLFVELLRARLQTMGQPQVAELHLRAAVWYDQNDLAIEAVHHALAIPNFDLAAEVMQRAILEVTAWSSISATMFLGWLNALPAEVVRTHPWLRFFASRVLTISGQQESGERTLLELESSLRQDPVLPDAGQILALAAIDRASYAAVRGEVQQAIQFAHQALAHRPPQDTATQVRIQSILGLSCFRAGDMEGAERAFSKAIDAIQVAGKGPAGVLLMCNLADVYFVRGQLRQALRICEQALQLGIIDGEPPQPAIGFVNLEMGKILYEQHRLPEAVEHLTRGLELLNRVQITIGLESGYGTLAQARQAQGDAAGALAAIEQAMQVTRHNDVARLALTTGATQARIWLAQGELEPAGRWARDYARVTETEYLREFEDLTLARVLLAHGEPDRAQHVLDTLLSAAEAAGRMGSAIEALALHALARQALGDGNDALRSLARALDMAEPEGFVRIFVDSGRPMAELLRQARARGMEAGYADKLLEAFQHPSPHQAPRGFAHPSAPLIEPLTAREMEVLQCLGEGLSNAEIGQRLFISLPTVKSHTRNIYGKLDVTHRAEAVARARKLGILPT